MEFGVISFNTLILCTAQKSDEDIEFQKLLLNEPIGEFLPETEDMLQGLLHYDEQLSVDCGSEQFQGLIKTFRHSPIILKR
jgi:hypothetical protein